MKWTYWKEATSVKGLIRLLIKDRLNRIRHPKEGRFSSHRVYPRFPLSVPREGQPTLAQYGWVLYQTRGNIKRSALGEYSLQGRTLKWKLRMYTFFHHVFKRSFSSEREETLTIWFEWVGSLKEQKREKVSKTVLKANEKKDGSDKMALASTLCALVERVVCCEQTKLYSSAWSYKTGKRIRSSYQRRWKAETHQVRLTSP